MADASIKIGAEDAASGPLARIKRELQGLEGAAKGGIGSLTSLIGSGGLLAGSVALGAVALRMRETISALDDLADAAPGLGMLASELSAFQLTAKAAGIDSGQFGSAVTKLNQRLTDAAAGGRESAEIFKALGISVKDGEGNLRSTSEVLREVADRFSGYSDGAQKSALAMELFGKTGAKFIAFLNEGGEGLSKFGGASEQAIQDAARLQGNIDRLAASWEKLWIRVAGGVAGSILGAAQRPQEETLRALSSEAENLRRLLLATDDPTLALQLYDQLQLVEGQVDQVKAKVDAAGLSRFVAGANAVRGAGQSRAPSLESADARAAREKAEREAAAERKRLAEEGQRMRERAIGQEFADAQRIRANRAKLAQEVEEDNARAAERQVAIETQQNEAARRRLEQVQASLMTERELEQLRYDEQIAALQTALALRQTTEDEYRRLREEAELQHQARLGDITAQGAIARRDFARLTAMQQTQTVLGELQNLTQGVATKSRAMFEVNKVSGIANAIVNTYESVTKTMAKYPYPINLALAGVTLAAGMAQVNAIRSAKFGTSTSAPSISGGGAVPVTSADVPSPTPVTPPSAAPARSDIRIRVEGLSGDRLLTSQQVRDLIRQIGEEAGFGANVSFVAA